MSHSKKKSFALGRELRYRKAQLLDSLDDLRRFLRDNKKGVRSFIAFTVVAGTVIGVAVFVHL